MTEKIIKLRKATGAGVMDCKGALEEARGDFDKAKEIIQEKGLAKAQKREGRETGAGLVISYVHNSRIGALLELRSETDFVAKSEPFKELAHDLVMQLAAIEVKDEKEFLAQPFIKDELKTVKDLVNEVISKTGENIKIGKFFRIEI